MFDTDAFRPLITWAEGASGKRYGTDARDDRAFRTLADHGRAMTFLAADGVRPGNEGREYILRRIIRRAVSEAGQLGLEPGGGRRPGHAGGGGLGRRVPGAARARRRGPRRPRRRGGAVRPHPHPGPAPAGRRDRPLVGHRDGLRLRRLPPLRHLRLPAGPHPRGRRRRGPEGGRDHVRAPHAGAARALPRGRRRRRRRRDRREGGGGREGGGAHRVRRLGRDGGRHPRHRAGGPRRRHRAGQAGALAVLRRGRRPGVRHRRHRRRPRARPGGGGLPHRLRPGAARASGGGRPARRRGGDRHGRRPPPPPDPGEPHRHPRPQLGAARDAGTGRPPGRLLRGPRQAALRLHPPRPHRPGDARAHRADGQRARRRGPAGGLGDHGPPGRRRPRRDRPVRGEVRRARARALHRRLLEGALRRHPRVAHRARSVRS